MFGGTLEFDPTFTTYEREAFLTGARHWPVTWRSRVSTNPTLDGTVLPIAKCRSIPAPANIDVSTVLAATWYVWPVHIQVVDHNYSLDAYEQIGAHEIGHAMGLGHSHDPRSIMYPVAEGAFTPTDADIERLHFIQGLEKTLTRQTSVLR